MKKINKFLLVLSVLIAVLFSFNASAQKRLPDGTIIYPDGTTQRSNGAIKYPANTNNGGILSAIFGANKNRTTTLSDGSILYPDGTRQYPNGKFLLTGLTQL